MDDFPPESIQAANIVGCLGDRRLKVTDQQVRKLMREKAKNLSLEKAALKSGMSEKTARKYADLGCLPSELPTYPRSWRTRKDPFNEVWAEIERMLEGAPELEAKSILNDFLLPKYGDRFTPGQLRTLQRKIKIWRATKGPAKEAILQQNHRPGEAFQTDFTNANKLGITIKGEILNHLLCNISLPYSNWQWASVCYSESIMALKKGIQAAIFELGFAPRFNQTDNSTSATHKTNEKKRGFNEKYIEFLSHFGMQARTIAVGQSRQNGDVESLNKSLKKRINQHLLLRGSRDFLSVVEYEKWFREILRKHNSMKSEKLAEETKHMNPVIASPLPEWVRVDCRVGQASTVSIKGNTYSVPSRLVGEILTAHVYEEKIIFYYGSQKQLEVTRLRGRNQASINYRHIIWSLVKKPAAFARFKYRSELFPSKFFRKLYDILLCSVPEKDVDIEYLRILHLAAANTQEEVETAICLLLDEGHNPSLEAIKMLIDSSRREVPSLEPLLVDLSIYDNLLEEDNDDTIQRSSS